MSDAIPEQVRVALCQLAQRRCAARAAEREEATRARTERRAERARVRPLFHEILAFGVAVAASGALRGLGSAKFYSHGWHRAYVLPSGAVRFVSSHYRGGASWDLVRPGQRFAGWPRETTLYDIAARIRSGQTWDDMLELATPHEPSVYVIAPSRL